MLQIDREVHGWLGRGDSEEAAAIEDIYRQTQEWIKKVLGPRFEDIAGYQANALVRAGAPKALGISAEDYLASLPKVKDQPFSKITQDTGLTRFEPLLVETRLPLLTLLNISGVVLEDTDSEDVFDIIAEKPDRTNPYIAWMASRDGNPNSDFLVGLSGGSYRQLGYSLREALSKAVTAPHINQNIAKLVYEDPASSSTTGYGMLNIDYKDGRKVLSVTHNL